MSILFNEQGELVREIFVLHSGTMRFWGDWFGRPMDNFHTVVNTVYNESAKVLVMTFDNQEECTIYSPVGITSTKNSFYIEDAKAVEWSWYDYGKAHIKENRFKIQYTKENADTAICQKIESIHTRSITTYINTKGFYAVEIC